jgi:hypothetical protein
VTLRMKGRPAKLGDGGHLVDADSCLEHGGSVGRPGRIVI